MQGRHLLPCVVDGALDILQIGAQLQHLGNLAAIGIDDVDRYLAGGPHQIAQLPDLFEDHRHLIAGDLGRLGKRRVAVDEGLDGLDAIASGCSVHDRPISSNSTQIISNAERFKFSLSLALAAGVGGRRGSAKPSVILNEIIAGCFGFSRFIGGLINRFPLTEPALSSGAHPPQHWRDGSLESVADPPRIGSEPMKRPAISTPIRLSGRALAAPFCAVLLGVPPEHGHRTDHLPAGRARQSRPEPAPSRWPPITAAASSKC